VSEISLSCTFAGARFYISSDTWNSLIVTSMIYFEADENGNYIWKDCKKIKSHVFGTQISFVTLWEIATKLKQNKESTPLWVNWTFFFSKYDTYLVHAHFVPFYIDISIQSPFLLNYICVAFSLDDLNDFF
jgi:uncharacterized membrane protein